MRFLAILFLAVVQVSYAQSDNLRNQRQSFDEILWSKTYDDTTRALARVFIIKNNELKPKLNRYATIAGVSVGVVVVGGLLYGASGMAGPVGLVFVVGGLIYTTIYGIASGIQLHRLHPYTKRKFDKLLKQYKDGDSLPSSYQQELVKYLM